MSIRSTIFAFSAVLTIIAPASAQIIDHSNPSTNNADLVANQNYNWGPIFMAGRCRLTDKGTGEISSIYYQNRVNVNQFRNSFIFQILSGGPGDTSNGSGNDSDGFTFTIQNEGLAAMGLGGGNLGYGDGIHNSVAVKFDTVPNGWDKVPDPSFSSTGLYANGQTPAGGTDLLQSNVNLRSQHPMRVDMEYDGATLFVAISDLVTGAIAREYYKVDIPHVIGSQTAFVGFTAATGDGSSAQDLLKWYWASPPLAAKTASRPSRSCISASRKVKSGETIAPWPTTAIVGPKVHGKRLSARSTPRLASR
jgi:hypothetical protein